MKKSLYLSLLLGAALQLTGCSDSDSSIFGQSAAERLDASRKAFTETLSADGGLWAMEYYSNIQEPGYVFVMQFNPDNSVSISADHIWINNEFNTEKSLWEVISDNGSVLSFNSYNNIFHIFADPENIEGPLAPSDPSTGDDINEIGYGHEGDYEFMLMEDDGQTIRLLGKKRGLPAWLHRLPADTDPEQYLAGIRELRTQFSSKFPVLTMTETATGACYDVSNMSFGVPVIAPRNTTSAASRTVSGTGLINYDGLTLLDPIEVIREDNSTFEISAFSWADDGSLVADGLRIAASAPGFNLSSSRYGWRLDAESMSPVLAAAFAAASQGLQASAGNSFDLRNVELGFSSNAGRLMFTLTTYAGKRLCRDYGTIETNADGSEVSITLTDANRASADFDAAVPAFTAFKQLLSGNFKVSNISAMNPARINFTSLTNPDVSFSVDVI